MDKYIYDENNGLWYKRKGDYYIPCLTYQPKKKNLSAHGGERVPVALISKSTITLLKAKSGRVMVFYLP